MNPGSHNAPHASPEQAAATEQPPAARKRALDALGRTGFVARGLVYLVVGWIALTIAFERRGAEADRTGALEVIAGKSFGLIVLWFLVVGFAGMAVWLAMLVVWPELPEKKSAGSRIASTGKALVYVVAAYTTARFAVTGHASRSSNQESADFTADLMRHGGGRWLVGAVGAGLVIGGVVLIEQGLEKRFAQELQTGSMSEATRRGVLILGTVGNLARGVIAVGAGSFLISAAVTFDPSRARGVDGTLRAFTGTSIGPFVLVVVALGLAAFGVYSFCLARWRQT